MKASGRRAKAAVAGGILLVFVLSVAACRTSAATGTAPVPTVSPTTAATVTPAPWILIGSKTDRRVAQAVIPWADSRSLTTRLEPLEGQLERPPPGLRGVVANEAEILDLHEAWSNAGIVFVVLDPVSMGANETTSVIGPGMRFDQAGFLAGVAAGLATSAGGAGQTAGGGESAGDFAAGFDEGLRYACPKCRSETVSEPGRAPFGVDVVAVSPSSGPIAEIPKEGAPWVVAIGDADLGEWADRVAARVRAVPEALVTSALARLLDGSAGEQWSYAADNGGLRVELVNPEAISPGRQRLLREAENLLASGFLVVMGKE